MFLDKNLCGWASILLAVVATVPYWRHVLLGKIKPHMFSWTIWALLSGIAAAARAVDHAGPGAWAAWAAALSCGSIALLSFFKGDKSVTRSEVISFVAALAAIPVWLATDDPLLAVVIVTAIDLTGYYPTVRKSYHRPHEEAVYNYVVANVIHGLSLAANASYTLTTTLTPVVIFAANTALIGMVLYRRKCVRDCQA